MKNKGIEIWYNSKEEWLADRENHLGTTDGICIIGESPFKTPLDVYNERLGTIPKFEGNESTRAGSHMEPHIVKETIIAFDAEIEYFNKDDTNILGYRHPDYDFIQSSPDAILIIDGIRTMIEVKTTAMTVHPDFIDSVAPYWLIQANTNCIMAGCERYMIAYIDGTPGFKTVWSAFYEPDYDAYQVFINAMVEFWTALENSVPPKPTTKKDIENYYQSINDLCITINSTQESNLVLLRKYQDVKKEAEKMEDYYKGQLALFMENAEYLIGTDGSKLLSYKSSTRKSIDADRLREEYPDLAKELTKETMVRTMRLSKTNL